jgi:REP element-mobilizing transposase RayT
MPQTFTQLHYHIVFSTRQREPVIVPEIRQRLWEYLGGIVHAEGGIPRIIGGVEDHVHLLVTLRQTIHFAEFMRLLKTRSSTWAHESFPQVGLWWQTGYGAFTVSHFAIPAVTNYIEKQEEHHSRQSFQDEFRLMLNRHEVESDEEHMWD